MFIIFDEKDDARFWMKVDKQFLGCWKWAGITGKNGYGRIKIKKKFESAHRLSFSIFKGPIPAGMQIDHLCRVRNCVNPDHLEAVTARENILRGYGYSAENSRKTHCKRGHLFGGDNLKTLPNGSRRCITCSNNEQRERWREKNPGLKTRILRGPKDA